MLETLIVQNLLSYPDRLKPSGATSLQKSMLSLKPMPSPANLHQLKIIATKSGVNMESITYWKRSSSEMSPLFSGINTSAHLPKYQQIVNEPLHNIEQGI